MKFCGDCAFPMQQTAGSNSHGVILEEWTCHNCGNVVMCQAMPTPIPGIGPVTAKQIISSGQSPGYAGQKPYPSGSSPISISPFQLATATTFDPPQPETQKTRDDKIRDEWDRVKLKVGDVDSLENQMIYYYLHANSMRIQGLDSKIEAGLNKKFPREKK